MKSVFFVDGFNLYHAIRDAFDHGKYKWLNLKQLALNVIEDTDELRSVHYFTAFCDWDKRNEMKHRTYVEALTKYGIQTVEGKFMPVTKRFKKRHMRIFDMAPYVLEDCIIPDEISFVTNEEKRTDVNIAIKILDYAYQNYYEHAYVVTADSDIAPAIQAAKTRFPKKKFTVVLPIGHHQDGYLCKVCDSVKQIDEECLRSSLLPNPVLIGKKKIYCPPAWR